jgi:hypothetical protein
VIWGRDTGSCGNDPPWGGKSRGHNRGHRGAARPLVRDEAPQGLKPRAPRWPPGVPPGVEEARRALRERRQTGPMPPRVGHEAQTPGCSTGFRTPQAIVVAAQRSRAVRLDGGRRPPLQRQADALGGTPVDSGGDQPHQAARQRLRLATHQAAAGAPARATDAPRAAPVGRPAHGDGALI